MTEVTDPVRSALVLGGASDIGLAIVRRLCERGLRSVVLATRDTEALQARLAASPLPVDEVHVEAWDALEPAAHEPLLARTRQLLGELDVVVCAVGSLGHHSGRSVDTAAADSLIRTNFAGPAAALLAVARALVEQGHGRIVVLSSVAGARARKSNFVYGSAKAGLDAFAQGLADSLADTPVGVMIVRPGFVTTKMTAGLEPAPLATTADAVADSVADALGESKGGIVWVPSVLGPAFAVLRNVPAPIWRRIAGDR